MQSYGRALIEMAFPCAPYPLSGGLPTPPPTFSVYDEQTVSPRSGQCLQTTKGGIIVPFPPPTPLHRPSRPPHDTADSKVGLRGLRATCADAHQSYCQLSGPTVFLPPLRPLVSFLATREHSHYLV